MSLTRYGFREWGAITIIALVAGGGAAMVGWWWALAPLGVVWLGLAAFFRDPWRRPPEGLDSDDLLSPADGCISAVESVDHHEATDGPAVIVRIFLSVLDVHINRAPCDGTVISVTHAPGKYLDARKAESARVNESNLMVLERSGGMRIGVRQVSGAIARRIVCATAAGDKLSRGERYGMIKFGSTTELITPGLPGTPGNGVKVHVKVGDRVKGGVTVLATINQ